MENGGKRQRERSKVQRQKRKMNRTGESCAVSSPLLIFLWESSLYRFIDSYRNSALSLNNIRSLRRQLSWRWGLGIHPKQTIHTLRLFLHNWLTDKSDSFTDILKYDLERSHSGASGFQKAKHTFFISIKENYCLH